MFNELLKTVFWPVLIFIIWAVYSHFRRRPLLSFFGVYRTRRLYLFLSQISVLSGGSIGNDRRPRSFQGRAITFLESLAIARFQHLFRVPAKGIGTFVRHFRRIVLDDVVVEAFPAQHTLTDFDRSTSFVTLGSPGYNGVSGWIERNRSIFAQFADDNKMISINGVNVQSDAHPNLAFLQKLSMHADGRVAFYAAGITEISTLSAYKMLIDEWSELRRQFGNREFCVVFSVNPEYADDRTIIKKIDRKRDESDSN